MLSNHTYFYPRSPCGERLIAASISRITSSHFYPRSPCGERPSRPAIYLAWITFLSTLSLRRATNGLGGHFSILRFLSTLSLRRATFVFPTFVLSYKNFYPRSPCGERPGKPVQLPGRRIFLSTLSLRRATRKRQCSATGIRSISIHALLAESDAVPRLPMAPVPQFLSTLSLRRATCASKIAKKGITFLSTLSLRRATRAPERAKNGITFLSTLSLRRATADADEYGIKSQFLSTLSLRRATPCRSTAWRTARNFYPRSPCGERP